MRLAKIKNKYLFKSDDPEGIHTYAVYYDRKKREHHAIGLTHLYVKDKTRFNQVKRGMLMVENFKEFKNIPSGVKNFYYSKDKNGKKINLKDNNVVKVHKRFLPKKQADKIKKFAYKNYNK